MQEFHHRLVSSAVLIAVVFATLFWLPLWAYAIVVTGFVAIALFEFFTMVRHRGVLVHRPLCIGLGVIFTLLVTWRSLVEPGYILAPMPGDSVTVIRWAWDVFWPVTIIVIFLRQFTRQNTFETLSGIATTLFGLAYVAGLLSYLLYIRVLKHEHGAWLVLFLIIVTKMADVGALIVGKLMGRHTLMPRISPNKTVEGFVGAILCSAAAAVLASPMVLKLAHAPLTAISLGLLLGLVGQVGDLAESLIKRDCQVKDSSRLFPGLGGMLDVLDSLLFTAPLFYAFLIYG